MRTQAEKKDFGLMPLVFARAERGEDVPLRFCLGGEPFRGVPGAGISREPSDANLVRRTFRGKAGGLLVTAMQWEYRDYPVVEWTAEFENTGGEPSGILSDILLGGEIAGDFSAFVHGNGDTCRDDGYEWFRDDLKDGGKTIAPDDGTSCHGAFPYMKLVFADYTVRAAVGWPATWKAEAERTENGVRFEAGQLRCHFRVMPGEKLRTPRLTFMISAGDEARSRNLWRRWYIDHILPRENGKPLAPALCLHYWGCEGKPEHTAATEENQLRAIERYRENGLIPDIWWIDAGWYKCDYNWPRTGTWKPDPDRFPNGLGPVGRACDEIGARFLLWFEPERVTPGTELAGEHPDWLLPTGREGDGNCLLDLGNEACRAWLTERVDSIIKEGHIRVYRQDFNFSPRPCWERAESEDRIGALENRHVQGYLAYWDALIDRNPGLWIDSCASGGRRNDLETMRRAVPLHYTDVGYGDIPVKQKQYREMFEWIPYFRSHNMAWDREFVEKTLGQEWTDNDDFTFETAMAPAVTYMTWWDADDEQFARTKRAEKIWRRAARIMLDGDYEPLTECRKSAGDWYAMRFETDTEGFVQIMRNREAEGETFTVPFDGYEGKKLAFETENGDRFTLDGETLRRDGLTVSLPKRAGTVIFYRIAEN